MSTLLLKKLKGVLKFYAEFKKRERSLTLTTLQVCFRLIVANSA
jgi:hypothetical protein